MRPLQSGVILVSFVVAVLVSYSASQQNVGDVADVVKQSSAAVVLIVISNSAGEETALARSDKFSAIFGRCSTFCR